MFGSKDLLFTSEKYGVAKSLRFRSGSSTYLNRTFGTPTNNNVWTYSAWVKRGSVSASNSPLFAVYTDGNNYTVLSFDGNQQLSFNIVTSGVARANSVTNNVFRDPSAWYHVLLVANRGEAIDFNRIKMYINGSQVTSWSTTPTWDNSYSSLINASGNVHLIGNRSTSYFDGYMAEVNFIDGQALTASAFGFYDNNGIWQPQGYTGTYGTNNFYLKFTDVGATSGANSGYGKDFSGFNTNYWTTNNFNSTSTSTSYDSMYDSPVNASNGITGIGNYCIINPLSQRNSSTVANGNLTGTLTAYSGAPNLYGSQSVSSGKYYWEITYTSYSGNKALAVGIVNNNAGMPLVDMASGSAGVWYYSSDGNKRVNGSSTAYGATYDTGDVIGVALDVDTPQITFYKNNTSQGSFSIPSSGTWTPGCWNGTSTGNQVFDANFGQRPFAYTPPSGYSALNTQNLTTPTITNGASYMAAVTYQGATAPNTVTTSSTNSGNNPLGIAFQPDLVWIKSRSAATDNKWTDVVRGTTKALISNTTGTETTDTNGLTAFTTSGFTVGSDTTYNNTTGPATYVAWEWKAGGTAVSGTGTGSITNVSYSADQTAGFSIIKYTGSGTAGATITHGLGAAPSFVIAKTRDLAAKGWTVYHKANGAGGYTVLSSTAAYTADTNMWYNTAPSSSVIYFGTDSWNNNSGSTYVCYAWAPIAGYSAFGSYTGNGSTDGPFVYTGFRSRWILFKKTSATSNWSILDTSRDAYNVSAQDLLPNSSAAETTGVTTSGAYADILSNGFKCRGNGGDINDSGATYIYAAFAENPFKIARAR